MRGWSKSAPEQDGATHGEERDGPCSSMFLVLSFWEVTLKHPNVQQCFSPIPQISVLHAQAIEKDTRDYD